MLQDQDGDGDELAGAVSGVGDGDDLLWVDVNRFCRSSLENIEISLG